MTYTYQLFGAMTGWSFFYGCMLGMASPATYLRTQARIDPVDSDDTLVMSARSRTPGLSAEEPV
ncbi:hypothetical protein SAMN05421783_107117 [Thiocapsa roseopersicina]|uniref:Uncharacterized protein n=1 Tax=Thiocapsa roseopersicina TaxID=1058 RepID=A0A1H2VR65_THIRO|nr:hypothetical protein SAMN05421783_107117 [Thiocapsa roseopersicina]